MDNIEDELMDILPCIEERRSSCSDEGRSYDRLNLAQKFSVSKLSQFGYQLLFVRGKLLNTMAILKNDACFVTVGFLGEIDTSPNLSFRKNG